MLNRVQRSGKFDQVPELSIGVKGLGSTERGTAQRTLRRSIVL